MTENHSVKKVYLLRHGDVQADYEGCYRGSLDISLSPNGIRQCQALREYIKTLFIDEVLCSPLQRTRQSCEALGVDGELCSELREIDFGDWEGLSFAEIEGCWPDEVTRWSNCDPDFGFPGGESLVNFKDRLNTLGDRVAASDQSTLLITHGGVIRALICHWLGLEWRNHLLFNIPTGSLTYLELYGKRGVLCGLGQRAMEVPNG